MLPPRGPSPTPQPTQLPGSLPRGTARPAQLGSSYNTMVGVSMRMEGGCLCRSSTSGWAACWGDWAGCYLLLCLLGVQAQDLREVLDGAVLKAGQQLAPRGLWAEPRRAGSSRLYPSCTAQGTPPQGAEPGAGGLAKVLAPAGRAPRPSFQECLPLPVPRAAFPARPWARLLGPSRPVSFGGEGLRGQPGPTWPCSSRQWQMASSSGLCSVAIRLRILLVCSSCSDKQTLPASASNSMSETPVENRGHS